MTSTALVTFLLTTKPCHTVHLLGSWDNFTCAYPMEKDPQRGQGNWRGCHTFKNVICDGDPSVRDGEGRSGLKMGGTYWYYYQINGETEYHDATAPSTTTCPLLPGQNVNILEVPREIPTQDVFPTLEPRNLLPLDPKDSLRKFSTPLLKRKRPVSAICLTSAKPIVGKEWHTNTFARFHSAALGAVTSAFKGCGKAGRMMTGTLPRETRYGTPLSAQTMNIGTDAQVVQVTPRYPSQDTQQRLNHYTTPLTRTLTRAPAAPASTPPLDPSTPSSPSLSPAFLATPPPLTKTLASTRTLMSTPVALDLQFDDALETMSFEPATSQSYVTHVRYNPTALLLHCDKQTAISEQLRPGAWKHPGLLVRDPMGGAGDKFEDLSYLGSVIL